jgi:hypothetical protein
MLAPLAKADACDHLVDPFSVRRLACKLERQDDVLLGAQHRQQVEELEDESDLVAAQQSQWLVVQGRPCDAVDERLTRGWLVEPGEDVQQCRLAGPRGPITATTSPARAASETPRSASTPVSPSP